MTRHDLILKWTAYAVALVFIAVVNYYVLGPLPMALPLLLPAAAVAIGTLEGPSFGAACGIAAGALMMGLGHDGPGCVAAASAAGWLSGLVTQYLLRRDLLGHMLCSAVTALCWEAWQVGSRYWARTAGLEVLLRVAAPELVWSVVLAVPVYWVGRFCCTHYGRLYYE